MRAVVPFALVALLAASAACSSSSSTSPDPSANATDASSSSSSAHDGGAAQGEADASASTGGGDDASTPPPSSPEAQKACADVADAVCAKLSTCSPFALSVTYGDVATCKTRFVLGCAPAFGAAQTSAKTTDAEACAQSIGALACDRFLAGDLGSACATKPGGLADGSPCGANAQCQSTFCAIAPDASCGKCAKPTAAGDPCVDGACSAGTVCPKGATKCQAPGTGAPGATCTYQEDCDLAHASGCNTTTQKCIQLTVAQNGQCGVNGASFAVCPESGTCSGPFAGTCAPAAKDGASCSTADTGAHCVAPAKCIGGKCVVPDPTTCH